MTSQYLLLTCTDQPNKNQLQITLQLKSALNNAPHLDLTVTKYEIITGDLSHSQSSASFHNFESDVVSYFNPGKINRPTE
jgi:hypothetical protein